MELRRPPPPPKALDCSNARHMGGRPGLEMLRFSSQPTWLRSSTGAARAPEAKVGASRALAMLSVRWRLRLGSFLRCQLCYAGSGFPSEADTGRASGALGSFVIAFKMHRPALAL